MFIFWDDERCVPPEHAESNFHMARESWISQIQMPPRTFTAWRAKKSRAAADPYEQELQQFFAPGRGQLPRFDCILLSIGEDDHTASLFPGGAALDKTKRWVTAV